MRLYQGQDNKKQPGKSATPHTMALPPPGHLMHDIMRISGQLPREPNKPIATLSKFVAEGRIKLDRLAPIQTPSSLNNLSAKIYTLFADGTQMTSIRFTAI